MYDCRSPALLRRAFFPATRRAALFFSLLLWGCTADKTPIDESAVFATGHVQNPAIRESSGLAGSSHEPRLLWTLNDSGSPAELFALADDGSDRGRILIDGASNRDWEDLASGDGVLAIADIGDNLGIHPFLSIYLIDEPKEPFPMAVPFRRIDFTYPEGPRDAEALAIDRAAGVAYVLSKRTLPPELYSVPLNADTAAGPIVATAHGAVTSLPGPGASPLPYHWQPTAMDISADGRRAAILTYEALYVYERTAGQSWPEALGNAPKSYPLAGLLAAEAVTLIGDHAFITVEGYGTSLYRIAIGH